MGALPVWAATGCDEAKPTCTGGPATVIVRAQAGELRTNAQLRTQADGSLLATSLVLAPIADAGAAALGASAKPGGARGALIDAEGNLVREARVPAPKALTDREGSTTSIGVEWTGDLFVFRWVERTEHTKPDGKPSWTIVTHAQAITNDGHEGRLLTPAHGSCDDCTVSVSMAGFGTRTLLLLASTPVDERNGPDPNGATVSATAIAEDGTIATEVDLPWLRSSIQTEDAGVASAGIASGGALGAAALVTPIITSDGNGVFIISERRTWAIDPSSLVLMAGPVEIPATENYTLLWNTKQNELVAAYRATSDVFEEAGVASEPDLFVSRFDNAGRALASPQRFSTGTVAAIARAQDRYGTLVISADNDVYFAWTDGNGRKIGSDSPIGLTGNAQLELLPHTGRRFTAIRASADILRQEIRCGE